MGLETENNIVKRYTLEDGVTEVIIPDGVTQIQYRAFQDCTDLSSIIIPKTVTEIGVWAFGNCAGLTTLYIPPSVTSIGNYAFSDCKLVTNLSIKQWDERYGLEKQDYAINYMRHYQSGDPFFDDVKSDNNKYIRAHRGKLIRKITVNDTAVIAYLVREMWLTIDDIDYLLKNLGGNVEITAMLLDYKNSHFTDEYLEHHETQRFEKEIGVRERTLADWKKIYAFGRNKIEGGYILRQYKGTDTDIIIPDHIAGEPVTRIGRYCFSPKETEDPDMKSVRKKILSIYIPDTVICIEAGAFRECRSLAEIAIPNSVVNIENCAFAYCKSLTEVTLPEPLVAIPYGLFILCESLARVNIPNNVTYIGADAFSSCFKLTELDIPDSVRDTDSEAFSACVALKRITLPKGLKTIKRGLFDMCTALTKIEIPESVTVIESNAFGRCESFTEITIPNGVTSIEQSTFSGCKMLEKVTLPEGLKIIDDCAFFDCFNLHEISIPANVRAIAPGTFDNTKDLVISAPRGSYAIEFAKKNGIKFKELPI